MDYKERWEIIGEPLGHGGQAVVHKVFDKKAIDLSGMREYLTTAVSRSFSEEERKQSFENAFLQLVPFFDQPLLGALKVLHKPGDARDAKLAERRLTDEVNAIKQVKHPNLIEILDHDTDFKWYVSQYYKSKTLDTYPDRYAGNPYASLKDFRTLVSGVSVLHLNKHIHRDIKPQNIFIGSNGELILGDFGLVFYQDDHRTRVSETYENVGSRDWEPAWAQGMRVDDIRPTFDVFSLGKVLWSMISGLPKLRLWYYLNDQFNISLIRPDTPYVEQIHKLLGMCIVEHEKECLPDASALLEETDSILALMERHSEYPISSPRRICSVCGIGECIIEYDRTFDRNAIVDLQPGLINHKINLSVCNNCGHIDLFSFGIPSQAPDLPPAWQSIETREKRWGPFVVPTFKPPVDQQHNPPIKITPQTVFEFEAKRSSINQGFIIYVCVSTDAGNYYIGFTTSRDARFDEVENTKPIPLDYLKEPVVLYRVKLQRECRSRLKEADPLDHKKYGDAKEVVVVRMRGNQNPPRNVEFSYRFIQ